MANHFKTRHLFSVILNELENQSKRPFLKCFHTRFIIIILKCVLTWFIIIIYNSYGLLYDLSIIPMYASRGQINCFVSNWLFNVMETSLYFILRVCSESVCIHGGTSQYQRHSLRQLFYATRFGHKAHGQCRHIFPVIVSEVTGGSQNGRLIRIRKPEDGRLRNKFSEKVATPARNINAFTSSSSRKMNYIV